MQTITLQIPMSRTLKNDATLVAKDMGFSSLQEVVRVLVNKLARKQLDIMAYDRSVSLSPKSEQRYQKIDRDLLAGKNSYTAHSPEELIRQLND